MCWALLPVFPSPPRAQDAAKMLVVDVLVVVVVVVVVVVDEHELGQRCPAKWR